MLELLFWVFCGAWLLFFGVLTYCCCVLSSRLSAQEEESERIREWQREVREIRAS